MSPSLRNLAAEYVKSRIQNVNVKGRISNRLRKAKSKGLLQDAPHNEETSLADARDFCLVETNGVPQDHVRVESATSTHSELTSPPPCTG